jgi:hypothetical protein
METFRRTNHKGSAMNARDLIDDINETALDKYQSYGYAAGFFGSMLAEIIETLPEHQKANQIRTLKDALKKVRA